MKNKKSISFLISIVLIIVTLSGTVVFGANVHYREYNSKTKKYSGASTKIPRCSFWSASKYDNDKIRFSHDWILKKSKKATYKKSGLNIYECGDCHCRRYTKTIRIKKAEDLVRTYLESAKKYKVGKMNKCFKKKSKTYVLETDKRMRKVYKKVNKKIKWKITSITGSKKKCTLNAKVKIPNLYNVAYNASYDSYWYYVEHKNATYKDMDNYYYVRYAKWYKDYKVKTKTRYIKFKLVKYKGKWKIKEATREVIDIANALANEAEVDALKAYLNDSGDEYKRENK